MKILVWSNIAPAFWPLFSSKEEEEQWKKDNNVKLIEMDINEAPEKIYLHPDIGDKEFIRPWLKRPFNENSVEYTRTDAFIEKACEWLEKNVAEATGIDSYAITESFKQAMEKE